MRELKQQRFPGFDLELFSHNASSPYNVSNPRDLDARLKGNAEAEWRRESEEARDYELDARYNTPAGNVNAVAVPDRKYIKCQAFLKAAVPFVSSRFYEFTPEKIKLLQKYFPGQFEVRDGLAKESLSIGSQFYHLLLYAENVVNAPQKRMAGN